MVSVDSCAACDEPLEAGASSCPSCGNAPKRTVRKKGAFTFVAGIPLFFLNPPIGVILAIVGLFVVFGAWFVSANRHVDGSS
ncbi:hypothetical protein [Natrialbaceae archaeon AArc-T1-2]|uniref:hypothetical protein n=1 Tax=Natrialbaceae archaeon AArc-T1-2 TaxID=3053904 RepID=UPI00255AE7DC|nr:hypothetical protein [Natrialbaceae archaeon AArc-T1-2]WIV65673.1 hypothetical protein QQ977_08125 [Natrialbaceae archaeon AArc-T1-2]